MKILVTYFSQTGNTESIARAVYEELSDKNDTVLGKIETIDPYNLEYDIVFIGSPCHAGDCAAAVKDFLNKLPHNPRFSLAGLITHAAPVYERKDFQNCILTIENGCKEKGIRYLGSYDCQGRLSPEIHEFVKSSRNIPDDEWQRRVEIMNDHPDDEDREGAKEFARSLIKDE